MAWRPPMARVERMRRSRPRHVVIARAVFLCALLVAPAAVGADEVWNTVFTCHFPTHGTVVIDTRGESRSIMFRGETYPAQTGSYFFQGTEEAPEVDGAPIVIFFDPELNEWTFQGEATTDCSRVEATPSD